MDDKDRVSLLSGTKPRLSEVVDQIQAHKKRVEEDAKRGIPPVRFVDYITLPRDEMATPTLEQMQAMKSWMSDFKSVEKGFKPGQVMMLSGASNVGTSKFFKMFKEERDGTGKVHFDTECAGNLFSDFTDTPCAYEQSQGRALRKVVPVTILMLSTKQYMSRNEREGRYDFKVKGRHKRKRGVRYVDIRTMMLSERMSNKLRRLADKGFYK